MNLDTLKNIIKNPYMLFNALGNRNYLNWISDEKYLKILWRVFSKTQLNLDSPKTFNEKLQWLKLYDRKPEYTVMVDKYGVRNYIKEKVGEEYLIPLIGVWDNPEEINFDLLPDKFVLKCTHDCASIIICKDKSNFDKDLAVKKLANCLRKGIYESKREWPYKNVPRKIIAEKYMEDDETTELRDYKFFCFNGEVKCLYVSSNSHTAHQKLQFFDSEYKPIDCKRTDYEEYVSLPAKPINFDKMVEIAKKLSANIPHVRIDLYEVNSKIYFGECTFYTGSGYIPFEKYEWDLKFGSWIELPSKTNIDLD